MEAFNNAMYFKWSDGVYRGVVYHVLERRSVAERTSKLLNLSCDEMPDRKCRGTGNKRSAQSNLILRKRLLQVDLQEDKVSNSHFRRDCEAKPMNDSPSSPALSILASL